MKLTATVQQVIPASLSRLVRKFVTNFVKEALRNQAG